MANTTKEFPVIFTEGWDTRGSGVGEPVVPAKMWNAWLSSDDRGAIESMPGEGSFIDWSAHTNRTLLGISVGTRQGAAAVEDGDPEDLEDGAIHIVGVTQYGEVVANVYNESGISNVSMGSEHGGDQWCFPGIARLGNKFHIFQGQDDDVRKGQVAVMGSTTDISDISLPRPDTDGENVYVELGGGAGDNVDGVVRYWISEMTNTKESALSPALRRKDAVDYYLHFKRESAIEGDEFLWNGAGFNLDSGADWSIEFMVRMQSAPASLPEFIIGKRDGLDTADPGWSFHVATTGAIHFEVSDGLAEQVVNTGDVCDGEWHRISASYDLSDTEIKIWVDNVLKQTDSTAVWSSATTNVHAASVGVSNYGDSFWTGDITDVRVYNATEITDPNGDEDMHTSIADPGSKTGLTGYYPMNEGTGTNVDDKVDVNDGTLNPTYTPLWKTMDDAFGAAEIDAGDGSEVDIVFADTDTHGKKYRIYRSQANGAQPYYVSEFEPTTGAYTYTDNTPDRTFTTTTGGTSTTVYGLGDLPYLHGDEPPDNARAAVVHANRVYVAVGNRLYWTDITSNESYFTQDNGNWISVNPDDGDVITALVSDYDSILIFKSNHIYRLSGRRPEEFSLRPVIPGTENPVSVGAPNINAVCTTPEGVMFYWNRKVFLLQGSLMQRVSDPIKEELGSDNLSLTSGGYNMEYYTANMGYWAGRNQVWMSIGDSSSFPNKSFVFDMTSKKWVGMRSRGYINPQSVRSMAAWRADLADEEFVGASGAVVGSVLQVIKPTATKFHHETTPTAYDSYVELSPFFGGNLNNLKRFMWVDLIYEPQAEIGTAIQTLPVTYNPGITVEWWVDGDESALTSVSFPAVGPGDRAMNRININEVGKDLTIKVTGSPDVHDHWKILGITYGYQDLPSVSR